MSMLSLRYQMTHGFKTITWPIFGFRLCCEIFCELVALLPKRTVKSTTETLGVGTRKAIPVSLPFNSGITFPTALAAPVEAGMMFCAAPRPSRHNFPDGPSTVFCVAVVACTVVIKPSTISKLS
uniref:Uncharacterized protein n=1 Tax=Glossina brevipalpis TaxID=37001 RepID=A0A1A9W349_9MUSC